jgi:hypothetical protein
MLVVPELDQSPIPAISAKVLVEIGDKEVPVFKPISLSSLSPLSILKIGINVDECGSVAITTLPKFRSDFSQNR